MSIDNKSNNFDGMAFDDMDLDNDTVESTDQLGSVEDDTSDEIIYTDDIVDNSEKAEVSSNIVSTTTAEEPKKTKQKKQKPDKKQKKTKTKKQKAPKKEQKPKKKKSKASKVLKLILVLVIAVGGFIGYSRINGVKNADKHVTIADNTVQNSGTEVADNDILRTDVSDSSNNTENTETPTDDGVIKLNKPMRIALTVNTKLAGESEYSDHDAYIDVKYSNVVMGYDNVKEYLDEYNESATNRINLPDKDSFYKSSEGNDLVMYEVQITVPDDFPTNDAKHGYTGLEPEFSLSISGTEKEDALITKLYEFAIPKIYNIGDSTDEFLIGNTYNLRYMVTMPLGLTSDGYKLTLNYSNAGNTTPYTLESVDINDTTKDKQK